MDYRIEDLESLSENLRACLIAAGVTKTHKLLARCATPEGRAALAAESGVEEADILRCVHIADLLRVKGVGDGYVALLMAAGIASVAELKAADAGDLALRLAAAKARVKRVHRLPTLSDLCRWIEDAGALAPKFT